MKPKKQSARGRGRADQKNTQRPKSNTRAYFKGYKDFLGPFGAQRLSTSAQALLIALLCQYNGKNNGSLKMSRWRSKDVRQRAKLELLNDKFIFEVTKGRLPNRAGLYAVACEPLNDNPQHDPALVEKFSTSAWREYVPGTESRPIDGQESDTETVNPRYGIQTYADFPGTESRPSDAPIGTESRPTDENPQVRNPDTLVVIYPSCGVKAVGGTR